MGYHFPIVTHFPGFKILALVCESTILYASKILTLHVGNLMFWTKLFWGAYWRLESHNPAFILYHTPILLKAPPTPYLINRRRVLDLNLDSNSVKESNFAWVAKEDTSRGGFCSVSPTNIKHNDVIKTNIFISVDTGLSTRQAGVNGNARSDLILRYVQLLKTFTLLRNMS